MVVLNATEGNAGLKDFTGDVYLHTGVITNKSTSGSDWKYIPFGWDTNDPKVKATNLGDNKWEFKYLPSIREFFGVTDTEEIVEKVAIVYKGVQNGNIVKEGKDVGDADIFVELTEGTTAARFVQPVNKFELIRDSDTIQIIGIGTVSSGTLSLTLLKNDVEVATTTKDTLRFTYDPKIGDSDVLFKLIASNGASLADTADFFVTVRKNDGANLERPSGTKDGITYTSNTSVKLSLFAPHKNYIYVIGDFNNWTPSSDYLMNKDSNGSDSVWYWIEIDELTAGQEYGMQYLVDGAIRIADPYSELVLHETDDGYISDSVFKNLKPYPVGKTKQMVGVITPGKKKYQWQVTNFSAPDKDKLVIYELLLRDFIKDHSYTTLIDTLDYLDKLGINAIQFMPINEFDGNESWGYNPAFHLALDKYYGSPDEFKRLVDEAHKRGIAVILDVVLNHSYGQNPLVRLWNEGDYGTPTTNNPYFNRTATHPFNVGYDFNHESPITRYYTKRVMEYWINEYKIDGFRFDLSKGFTQRNTSNDVNAWSSYDQSRINIWFDYYNYMVSIKPKVYVILEHFADNSEEKILADGGMMLWGNSNHQYTEATMGYNSNLTGVLSSSRGFQFGHLVSYMESHDEQWMMLKNRKYGNSSNNYNIKNLATALDRQELAGVFFFPLPGPRMIWQFGELGYGYGDNGEECLKKEGSTECDSNAPGRTANKPIRWDYFSDPDRKDVYTVWSQLIKLRNQSEAFTRPKTTYYSLEGSTKYFRHTHSESDVVAVGNFDVNTTTVNLEFTKDGIWYDFFGNTTIDVKDKKKNIDLAPGEYKLFTTKEFDLVSSSTIENENIISSFKLHQNYPNPFNPSTNIKYDVAINGEIRLEVYNLLGQKVATLVDETKSVGSYTARFNASGLSSGVYLVLYSAGNKVQTQKIMLLK